MSHMYRIVDGAGRLVREVEIPDPEEIDQEYRDAIEKGVVRIEEEIAAEECGVSWILDLRIGLIAFLGAFTLILLLLWLFR